MGLGRAGGGICLQLDLPGFWQPRADIVLALTLGRTQAVQTKAGGGGDQPGFSVADGADVGVGPAQPGVLDDVLGIHAAAQQAVGQGEQAWAMVLEDGFGVHMSWTAQGRRA